MREIGDMMFLSLLSACDPVDAEDTAEHVDTDPIVYPPWAEMTREQRLSYMGDTVLPQMATKFRAHDPETYTDFTCATCHGEDMVAVDYAMPNGLFPLDRSKFPYSASADPEEAAWGVFMEDEVLPAAGALVDQDLYDYTSNPDGFSCFGCHAMPQ